MSTSCDKSTSEGGQRNGDSVDEEYYYLHYNCIPVKIARESVTSSTNDMKFCKAEQKLINRIVLSNHLKNQSEEFKDSIVSVNNSTFLRPATKSGSISASTGHAPQLHKPRNQYDAIVISWNGLGAPPEHLDLRKASTTHPELDCLVGELPYTRIWNYGSDRSGTRLRFHWSKVILYESVPELANTLYLTTLKDTLQRDTNETEFALNHVRCQIKSKKFSLKEILLQFQWSTGSNLSDQNRWRDILHGIHRIKFGSDARFAACGKTIFKQLQNSAEGNQALSPCDGEKHMLSLDAAGAVVDIQQTCSKVFFPSVSVADFMMQYCGGTDDIEVKSQDQSMHDLLRGKLVQFKVDGAKVVKGIESISAVTGSKIADDQKHSSWRGKIGLELRFPGLPCINVGTKFRPALLPAEMVLLLPGQTSKKLRNPELHTKVSTPCRIEDADDDTDHVLSRVEVPERFAINATAKSSISQLIKDNFDSKRQVIFVVPSVDSMRSALWKTFESSIRQILDPESKDQKAVTQPVVLSYHPGQDPTKLWKAQLINAKKCADGVPVAVVALRSDEHHALIYKIIKTLCEVDVGMHSVFMKLNSMEQKEGRYPGRGAQMIAKVMAKKIALQRSPLSEVLGKADVLDITIAVHIGQITIKAPQPEPNGNCTSGSRASKNMYVLTLSSRGTRTSENYRTTTKLLGPESVHDVELAHHVREFLKTFARDPQEELSHRVIILRSGYIPRSEVVKTRDSSLRLLPVADRTDSTSEKQVDPASPFDKNKMINNEISAVAHAIKELLGPFSAASYVLLSEFKDFALPE